jgi:hypothetical protein
MKRLLWLCPMLLAAQSALDVPPLAQVRNGDGRLTPIYGLAGNFVSGEPGPVLLAYANDGELEWRLEPGRLTVTRQGRTTVFPADARRAIFRGAAVQFPDSSETLRLDGDSLVPSSEEPLSQLAGRTIEWVDGKLRIFQPDGRVDEVACAAEPESWTAAGPDWAHLTIAGRSYLLRLAAGRAALYVLPLRGRP